VSASDFLQKIKDIFLRPYVFYGSAIVIGLIMNRVTKYFWGF